MKNKQQAAHGMVYVAIKKGQITKPSECSVCNKSKKLVAHHDDYDKPLDVRWLCESCHGKYHRSNPDKKFKGGPFHARLTDENLKAIQDWISGFRCKVSLNNAANMFMAEGIATIKKQGAK